MTIPVILYKLIISPIQLLFEFIFYISCQLTLSPGFSIIMMSLLINILLTPFYRRADEIQKEENDLEKKMKRGVDHIKKTFKGDERFMMLQTYYRQNNYKPGFALRGLVPLLLEIPFFIAAYNFLSGLNLLNGASFGIIKDLGAPDGLLNIFGKSINLLPILMTVINLASSAIYSKGASAKTRIQLYAMALLFLVILRDSASGLVFYWTLNNLYSLLKNIFVFNKPNILRKKFFKDKVKKDKTIVEDKLKNYFWPGAILMTILCGLLIPSSVINSSPEEFLKAGTNIGPSYYIINNILISMGTFVVWWGIFYGLAGKKGKKFIAALLWILCGVSMVNYMFFATKMGNLSPSLRFDSNMDFDPYVVVFNTAIILLMAIIMGIIYKKKRQALPIVYSAAILAVVFMSFSNVVGIKGVVEGVKIGKNKKATIPLSRTGKNVVVMMMDRAMGKQLPYIFKERPDLKDKFTGFTYYPNCISFGGHTNVAAPALFGGYEYTPDRNNARDKEKLADKHNEALKVLPKLFSEAGYKVTVCDPPYAGYRWMSDLSIYDDLPGVSAYIVEGKFDSELDKVENDEHSRERNFILYSYMKCSPLLIQPIIYNEGLYNDAEFSISGSGAGFQIQSSVSTASGFNKRFMDAYTVLENLSNITKITDGGKGNLLLMDNNTTHEPTILQKPDYKPTESTNNLKYDNYGKDSYIVDGLKMHMENTRQVAHYHVNITSYIELARWFDYLKENGVYDNTRIIIVSDHGRGLGQFDYQKMDTGFDTGWFRCLLMVKDFDKKGFETDKRFMTNADVPKLVTQGLFKDPKNPYTGKPFDLDYKKGPQKIMFTSFWNVNINNGNKFLPADWFSVHDDVEDMKNWKFLGNH